MIDLETMATEPDAVVLSIGACFFDLQTGKIGEKFYTCLSVTEQEEMNRVVDARTLAWWNGQSKDARKVFTEKKYPVDHCLNEFTNFILSNANKSQVMAWGNGSGFDISIMESLFRMFELPCPWLFYNVMDLRTFRRFVASNVKVPKLEGTNHHALDDAINQAKFVLKHVKMNKG